jgi:hypothetical protein
MATLFFSDMTNLSMSDADCRVKTRPVRQARSVSVEHLARAALQRLATNAPEPV